MFGSLGQGDSLRDLKHLEPVALPEGTNRIIRVSAGWGHSAVITGDGKLLVFGRPYDFSNILQINRLHSFSRELGRFVGKFTPTSWLGKGKHNTKESGIFTVPTFFKVKGVVDAVSCSAGLTAALTLDGHVYCFGLNRWGQCGVPIFMHVYEPTLVKLPERVTMIDTGLQHCLAVGHSGKVYAWGKGTRGQLGDGNNDSSNIPVTVKSAAYRAVAVSAGFNHSAALTAEGNVYVWGKGMSTTPTQPKKGGGSDVGSARDKLQSFEDQPKPRLLPRLGPRGLLVKEICSSNFTLVLRAIDDSLWAMGVGEEDRNFLEQPVPVQQATVAGVDVPAGQTVSSPQVVLGPNAVMRKGYQRVLLFDRGTNSAGTKTTWSTYGDSNERIFEVVVHDGEAFLHPMDGMLSSQEEEVALHGKALLDLSQGWKQTLSVIE